MKRAIDEIDRAMIEAFYTSMEVEGVRFVRLRPFEKRVERGHRWEQSVLRNASKVIPTLEEGWNVGLLLTSKGGTHPNPPGLTDAAIESQPEKAQ